MRTIPKASPSPTASRISRARVASTALAGLALLWVSSPPAPVEPLAVVAPVAVAPRPAADEFSIARVLAETNPQLAEQERARIARAVLRYSAKYELDPELVTAVIVVESSALPSARSPKGAMGLMQVMPAMQEPMGLVGNYTTVESNIEAGCLILSDNIRRMGEADGILAYFWGPNIRGGAYLERVRAARAEVRRVLTSS
jgi:soluble lytic murein transglycosylase-like protein